MRQIQAATGTTTINQLLTAAEKSATPTGIDRGPMYSREVSFATSMILRVSDRRHPEYDKLLFS
jgi:hypothetical protein